MKWLKNMENIAKGESPGKSPYCGSENTDYNCTIVIPEKRLGDMMIWCNDCMRGYHVSRMKVPEELKADGEVPGGIRF